MNQKNHMDLNFPDLSKKLDEIELIADKRFRARYSVFQNQPPLSISAMAC